MTSNDDEIVREYDALKAAGRELDGLVPVRGRVSKEPRAVFSLRLAPAELASISAAAAREGQSVSDFVREAALTAADATPEDASALSDIERRLERLEARLDEALAAR